MAMSQLKRMSIVPATRASRLDSLRPAIQPTPDASMRGLHQRIAVHRREVTIRNPFCFGPSAICSQEAAGKQLDHRPQKDRWHQTEHSQQSRWQRSVRTCDHRRANRIDKPRYPLVSLDVPAIRHKKTRAQDRAIARKRSVKLANPAGGSGRWCKTPTEKAISNIGRIK